MSTYILKHQRIAGEVRIEFDYLDRLSGWKLTGDISDKAHSWLFAHTPERVSHLEAYKKEGFTIELVPPDLSFSRLWDEYDYKFGDKKRAEKLFNALSFGDKILVFASIVPYDKFRATKPGLEKQYLETYLNKRAFENFIRKAT